MNRVFRISAAAVKPGRFCIPKTLTNPPPAWFSTESPLSSKAVTDLYGQFADKWVYAEVRAKEELIEKVSIFRDELLKSVKDDDNDGLEKVLEDEGWKLFKIYSDGAAMLELLKLLEPYPNLAIKK